MNNAEVLIKFKGDTKDIDKNTDNVSKKMNNLGNVAKSVFKGVTVAVTGTSVAIGKLVKDSVKAYADFEQLEGGIVSLFGEGSAEMQRIMGQSEEAYKTLTMSQNEYLNSFESSYPLVNAGLSKNADAIEYTNKVLQLSSDLFNTYGGSAENYASAINWALKGTYSYLDNLNLGIKGTQEGFVEAANKANILGREISSVNELTSDEIINVIQHYAEANGVWGKTAQEAGETIAGSLNMLKSSWSNLIVGFSKEGADLGTLFDTLLSSVGTFANNVLPIIEKALSSVVDYLPKFAKAIIKQLPEALNKIIPKAIDVTTNIIQSIAEILPSLVPVLMNGVLQIIQAIIDNAPMILQSLIDMLPVIAQGLADALPTLIPAIVEGIIKLMEVFNNNMGLFLECGFKILWGIVQGLINSIPLLLKNLPTIIESIINFFTIEKIIGVGKTLITGIGKGLVQSLPELIKSIPKLVGKIVNAFKNGLNLKDIGIQMIKGLWNGIKSAKEWILEKIGGFTKSILKGVKGFFGIHSPSKVMADEVGKYLPQGMAVGIEANADDVYKAMKDLGKISMNAISPQLTNTSSLHYSPNINVINSVDVSTDPLGQTVSNIKTFSGGAKNDYNYGVGV